MQKDKKQSSKKARLPFSKAGRPLSEKVRFVVIAKKLDTTPAPPLCETAAKLGEPIIVKYFLTGLSSAQQAV